MTAASLVTYLDINNPIKEVVLVTATTGYTYTSKKFGTVLGGHATLNEDSGTLTIPLGLAITGNVVVIHATGLAGEQVCLELYGRK